MSEEVIVKGFLNEDTLSSGKVVKTSYGDNEDNIEVHINLDGDKSLFFSKRINPRVKDDMPEVIGILQLLDIFVKEVQKAENPEDEVAEGEIVEDAANEVATTAEVGANAKGTVKGA